MTLTEAIDFIRPAIAPTSGTWADIGAGTGLFTEALMEILEQGKVIALDKSPHGLYSNRQLAKTNQQLTMEDTSSKVSVEIIDADFNLPLSLPPLDGILMANALHYAHDHLHVLNNVLSSLQPGGRFILIEYDTDIPNYPWVPNPVSSGRFSSLCRDAGLSEPAEMGRRPSIYRDGEMYIMVSSRL